MRRGIFLIFIVPFLLSCIGSERQGPPDPRLAQAPTIYPPKCGDPAPFHPWTPDARAYYVEYKWRIPLFGHLRTMYLSRTIRFDVLGSSSKTFTALWLEPTQVAKLRCISNVDYVAFVREVPINTGITSARTE
jgi:hypothetical protein